MRLLPTDERFFELLHDLAEQMPEGARGLCDLLDQPLDGDNLINDVRHIEHKDDGWSPWVLG